MQHFVVQPTFETLERSLLAELSSINRQIARLEEDRRSIRLVLEKAKRANALNSEVVRTTSANRLICERVILDCLRAADPKALPTGRLYDECKTYIRGLLGSTFRSYIFRLQERALIKSDKYGYWRLASSEEVHKQA